MQKYVMVVTYKVLGGHTHIKIRTGKYGCQVGLAGDLTMTNDEFEAWKNGEIVTEFAAYPLPEGDTK